MAYEQRDNAGSIFQNRNKTKDTHPTMTGRCMIDGKEFWISGWTKFRDNGEKWLSLSFTPVEDKPRRGNERS